MEDEYPITSEEEAQARLDEERIERLAAEYYYDRSVEM